MYLEALASGGGSDWFYIAVIHAPNGAEVHVDDGDEDIDATVASGNYIGIPVHNQNSTYTITVKMNGIAAPTQSFTTGITTGQMVEKTFEFAEIQLNYDDEFRGQTISFSDGTHSPSPAIVLPGAPDNDVSIFVPCAYHGDWTLSCVEPISGELFYSSPNPIPVPDTPGTIVTGHLFVIPNGSTVTPTDDIQTWLACGNIKGKSYTTLEEVLADEETLRKLLTSDNANDYLVRSKTWIKQIKVPTMTSNTTPSGEAFGSATSSGYPAWQAFDDNDGTQFEGGNTTPQNLGYKFTEPVKVTSLYMKDDGTYYYSKYKIQAKNDGDADWTDITDLISRDGQIVDGPIVTSNTNEYQYWRVYFETSSYIHIKTLQFYTDLGICDSELAIKIIGADDYASNTLLGDSDWRSALCGSEYYESVLNATIPAMTGYNTPSGLVTESSKYSSSYPGWYAFDKNESTAWAAADGVTAQLTYDFGSDDASKKLIKAAIVCTASSNAFKFKIQGSNDNFVSDIDDLCSEQSFTSQTAFDAILNTSKNYRYYRLYQSSTHSFNIKELGLYGREAGGVQTLLKAAGITNKPYLTIEEVLADHETVQKIMHSHDAVDYLATAKLFINAITSDAFAMRCIGLRNYAADTLLADEDWAKGIMSSDYYAYVLNVEVPIGATAISNSESTTYPASKIFDGIIAGGGWGWRPNRAEPLGTCYAGYDFGTPVTIKAVYAALSNDNMYSGQYEIRGSNDLSNWDDLSGRLDSHTGEYHSAAPQWYDNNAILNNNNAYRYYAFFPCTLYNGGTNSDAWAVFELQFYGRTDVDETIIHVYSAADDTITITPQGGGTSITCVTDSTGHGTIPKVNIPNGTYTFVSSVAKDPENLNVYYNQEIIVDDSLIEVWFMPDKVLYWFGYDVDLDECTSAKGWSYSGVSISGTKTESTNYKQFASGGSAVYGGANQNPISGPISGFHMFYTASSSNTRLIRGNSKVLPVSPTVPDAASMDIYNDSGNDVDYIGLEPYYGSIVKIYALWYD